MARQKPNERTGQQHPEQWRQDLNPHALEDLNRGAAGPQPTKTGISAFDFKDLHSKLKHLSADELKELRLLPTGTRLEQNAVYLDLNNLQRGEITGMARMMANPDNRYVKKTDVSYPLWNKLLGVTNPERLDTGNVR